MLYQLSYEVRVDLVAQLAEHWTSISKVAGSIPTVIGKTFQLARCGCTVRVTSQTSYSPEYITPSTYTMFLKLLELARGT